MYEHAESVAMSSSTNSRLHSTSWGEITLNQGLQCAQTPESLHATLTRAGHLLLDAHRAVQLRGSRDTGATGKPKAPASRFERFTTYV